MILDLTSAQLGWPDAKEVLNPSGAGPAMFAELAKQKIGRELERLVGANGVYVGILTNNSRSQTSEPPLALVCEFTQPASDAALRLAHRLAWNFCHCPMLVILEPHMLRLWDCCAPPASEPNELELFHVALRGDSLPNAEVEREEITGDKLSAHACSALHWLNLATGHFVREHQLPPRGRFAREGRADYLLLKNLKQLRRRLTENAHRGKEPPGGFLQVDICHNLLARLIFLEFLFQRKDSEGNTALNATKLAALQKENILRGKYTSLAQILRNRQDTYALFAWLNRQFNGDLFPSPDAQSPGDSSPLDLEKKLVKREHLAALADFIEGRIDEESGDRFLWRQYCFDVIPLEFVSSIYEEFVGKGKSVHYTPLHLVDFVLDQVLPWRGEKWDIRVLDPACGSGVFLVKAFQRLVHRWRVNHRGQDPDASILRRILEKNLLGVDINGEAVRVAAFSLYLAMCDEIDPRKYWTTVKFPPLAGQRLLESDFFIESQRGFRTEDRADKFELIVGNAPWGKKTATAIAEEWAEANDWSISNRDIGPLFLAKALKLLVPGGSLAMVQPTGALLLNSTGRAREFRRRFFTEAQVHCIVNLSVLRFAIFANAVWAPCIIVAQNQFSDDRSITYISPKGGVIEDGLFRLRIEPLDVHGVRPSEAMNDSTVWSTLIWGQRRDLALLRKLRDARSLLDRKTQGQIALREGIIRGKGAKRFQQFLVGKRILDGSQFPDSPFVEIDAKRLPVNVDYETDADASTDFEAFALPQLILKQSWHQGSNRFQAAVVKSTPAIGGVLCPDSYVSLTTHGDQELLRAIWAIWNSKIAVYFLLLTSGQFAAGIPKPLEKEMRALPVPEPSAMNLSVISSFEELDAVVQAAFSLNLPEVALVDDLFTYTLPDFKGGSTSPGRRPTSRRVEESDHIKDEPELRLFADYLVKVLGSGLDDSSQISVTIFQESDKELLPLRLIAIQFGVTPTQTVHIRALKHARLRGEMLKRHAQAQHKAQGGTSYTHNVVRIYTSTQTNGRTVPTVFLLKPDQKRYWTRSAAMHDGDGIVADLHLSLKPAKR